MKEITLENIEARLNELNIFELRQTARTVGVIRPAEGRKSECIQKVIAIAQGETEPLPLEERKQWFYEDKELVKDILAYRESVIGK